MKNRAGSPAAERALSPVGVIQESFLEEEARSRNLKEDQRKTNSCGWRSNSERQYSSAEARNGSFSVSFSPRAPPPASGAQIAMDKCLLAE